MLTIICLFLCLLICLGPFLAANVSCINSFLSSLLVFYVSFSLICWVLYTLPCFLVFCLLFVTIPSFSHQTLNFCIFSTLIDCGLLCFILYGVQIFCQNILLIFSIVGSFFVFQCVKSVVYFLFWREWLIFLTRWGLIWVGFFVCLFVFGFSLVSLTFCLFLLLLWQFYGHYQYPLRL